MTTVAIEIIGGDALAGAFDRAAYFLPFRVNAVTRTFGALGVLKIQQHASGRPGPDIITGEYRRGWHVVFSMEGMYTQASIENDEPQVERLEFGFNGVDSIGRRYSQPPFPHIEPARAELEPEFYAALEGVTKGLIA